MSTESKYFDKKECNRGNYSVPHMTEDINELRPLVQEELDVTSEKEEFFEEPYETPKSSNSSAKIKPMEHQRGKRDSVSDVDNPQEDQKVEETKEERAELNDMTEVVTGTTSHSFILEHEAEVPSDHQPPQTVVSAVSGVASNTSVCAKKQKVSEVPTEEKPNTSETVTQMLQDEMFKLVQQISFMSLMQVAQSTFASLQNVQQILQQHQPVHLEGIKPVHSAEGNASLKLQLPTQECKGELSQESTDFQAGNSLRDESNNDDIKNHLDMNVSVNLLENHHNETGFMPLSQHVHSSTHSKQLHLLAPSSGIQKRPKFIPIKKKNGYSNGFPLLRLESHYHIKPALLYPTEMTSAFSRPPPVPRVAWGSSDSIGNYQASYTPRQSESEADLNMSRYDPEIPGRMHKEEKRWAEVVHKEPPKHLNLDQYEGHQGVSPQQQFFANVNVDKAQITQNLGGIPLLRLDPAPRLPAVVRQPVTTTLGPIKPTTKETDCRETQQHTGILLLRLPQKKKAPKLIPPQELIAFEQRYQHHTVPSTSFGPEQTKPIQLLKADVEPFELRDVQSDRKRQKRREKKRVEEKEEKKKASVSFCPDDSINSISDAAMAIESGTRDQQAKSTSHLQDVFFTSMDTMGEGTATSEVHHISSTGKKVAETKDASTNTHPVLKSYRDVGISAGNEASEVQNAESVVSVPASEPSNAHEIRPPDMYLNLRFPDEVSERPLQSFLSDAPGLGGHEYISVIDIEDGDIFNNLPMIPESAEEGASAEQNEKFEIPSTAKFHHVAAAVTNPIPPEVLQQKDHHLEIVSSQVQTEDKNLDSAADSVTWNIVREDDRTLPSSGLSSKVIGKEYFSTKQKEIDMQFQALQKITENMEKDFRNARRLVKTIEDFEMAANSDLGAHPSFSEDAGVIDDEHYLSGMNIEDVTNGLKEGLYLESHRPSYTSLEVHSPASLAPACNFPSGIKSSSELHIRRDLCDSSSEDPLQITGLSGVNDIISDLVIEGDISPSDLGFTQKQAKKISRVRDSTTGHSQKTEKEKKEIQAWMKRKQKERMREYMRKLDEERQKEHNPFNPKESVHGRLTSKDIKLLQKKKEEKDKAMFSEHHSIRISQALSLMNEMLSEKVPLPANEHRPLSRTRSPPQEYRKRFMASTIGRQHLNSPVLSERRVAAKPSFGQKVHRFTPAFGLTQSKGNACMLLQKSTSRGRMRNAANCPVNSRHSTEYRVSRTSKQKPPRVATAVQTEDVDQESDRDLVSPWTVPDDIQRILQDTHDSLFQDSALHPVTSSPLGSIDTDGVSESTGSVLSKLDWKAVEAMVADVEDE